MSRALFHETVRAVPPVLAVLLLAAACAGEAPDDGGAAESRSEELHALFDREWQNRLDENPMFATSVGDLRNNDQLGSVAVEDLERRVAFDREILAELEAIDREGLSETDRVNAAIFERQLRDGIESFELGAWQIPINADSGFHIGFSRLPSNVPLRTTKHYEDYLSRLRQWPRLVEQHIANMRRGMERGFVLPKVVLDGYDSTYDAHLVEDPEDSVFWEPFEEFGTMVPAGDHERLRSAGRAAIREAIVPGYRAFSEFMKTEYVPACRDSIAATDLPEGEAYYQQRVSYYTTLPVTAQEVHDIGLGEVRRIRGLMEQILEEVQWDGTFEEFLTFLRTDSRFYAKTGTELVQYASWLAKRADALLPKYFGTLPRLPYGVEPVPEHIAPKYTTGRYVGPPEGSTEPGYYWVNTYKLDSRPLYNMPALTLHEAVPGHHLQNALAKEQGDLPNFRRYDYISAFGEGWGLYSEFLGEEMGMYDTPYDRFGRLTYEMWRACRLVVDTGMHALGWTRQQAMDFLAENTALPLHEIRTETDRYISWPAQALAYKMGELEIRRLRKHAEERLGSAFDIRAFHDAVLLGGSVPLPVLEENIERFIATAEAEGVPAPADGGASS